MSVGKKGILSYKKGSYLNKTLWKYFLTVANIRLKILLENVSISPWTFPDFILNF